MMVRVTGAFWSIPVAELLQQLETTPQGLTSDQARERRSRYGANLLPSKRRADPPTLLRAQFKSPTVLIMLLAAALSFFLPDNADALIILTIVLASLDSFLFSLALAVGLTPQLVPAIISINLAHGAKRMARQKVIVKRLASIENFGSMNVLCSDKTGTLTEGVVRLHAALDVVGHHVGFGNPRFLTGPDLRHMSNKALLRRVNEVDAFAEVEPNQQERIIPSLKKAGNVVGYMGDGINEMTIAADHVDREFVEQPRRRDVTFIRNFMVAFGSVSSVFDYLTVGVLLLMLQATPDQFRTGWVPESVISAAMIVLVIRSRKSLFQSQPGRYLLMATLLIPFTPPQGDLWVSSVAVVIPAGHGGDRGMVYDSRRTGQAGLLQAGARLTW
jgi:Cation transporter/ATPase, N-terminus